MAIKRPDIYEHQNADLAISDSDFVRGGRRKVADRAALYALVSKADQLKENVTIVRILSDSDNGSVATEVLLVDITTIGSASGWILYSTGGSTGTPATAATKVVEYTVSAGQTSITPQDVPDLANATSIISIGNAANDGHQSPSFTQREDQASTTKGYWFNPSTHTIESPSALFDQAYTLSITLALGVLGGGGGPALPTRDPYDVPTAKRKEVVDANIPAYLETDSDYYGKEFVDEVYGAGQPAYYKCMPSAPATTGGATVWKWYRIDIL